MATTMVKELLFELTGDGIEIAMALDGNGGAANLSYRSGEQTRTFSGEEITIAASDEGTRASVMLDSGAADGPVVLLTVIVPEVVFGDERSFDVSAAALRTTKRSPFGGVRPGPQQSFEALCLTGTASCQADDGGSVGTCRNWYASHDHMPPGPATLRVTGTCTFGTPGYEIELRRHEPQGINPKDLLLDKIVIPPAGDFLPQVLTDVEARYEEVTDFEYDSVTILPEGPSMPVEEVH